MYQRRARLAGLHRIDDDWQFLEFYPNELAQVLGFGAAWSNTHCDRLAHHPNLADRERRIISKLDAGHSTRRPDRLDVIFDFLRGKNSSTKFLWKSDIANARMRQWAAQECNLLQTADVNVPHEIAAAMKMPVIFLTQQSRAYSLCRFVMTRHRYNVSSSSSVLTGPPTPMPTRTRSESECPRARQAIVW